MRCAVRPLLAAAALLLVGCELVQEPEAICTAIGCDSQVVFELTAIELVASRSYEIEACLDETCAAATVEPTQHGAVVNDHGLVVHPDQNTVALVLPEGNYAGTRTASLRVRPDGEEPFAMEVEIELERTQPNGPNCPPVCWQAVVRA